MGPYTNTILISNDGINWIIRTAPSLNGLTTAAYAPELGYVLAAGIQESSEEPTRTTKYLISEQITKPIYANHLISEKIDEICYYR
jgi:hypothetical protein